MCTDYEPSRLSMFSTNIPFGENVIIGNRAALESLIKQLQEALVKGNSAHVHHANEDESFLLAVHVADPDEMDKRLLSPFAQSLALRDGKTGPLTFVRQKH